MRLALPPALACAALLAGASCSQPAATVEGEVGPVMVLTHSRFSFPTGAVDALEASVGEQVVVVVENDPASMLDLITASSAGSGMDLVVGLDSLTVGPFLDGDLTTGYEPAAAARLPPALRVGGDPITPISYTDVCFNYDGHWFDPPEPAEGERDDVVDAADAINDPTVAELPDAAGEEGGQDDEEGEDSAGEEGEGSGDEGGDDQGGDGGTGGASVRPAAPEGLGALGSEELAGLVVMPDPANDPFGLAFVAGLASTTGGAAPAADQPATDEPATDEPAGDGSTGEVPADPELVAALEAIRDNDLLVTDDFRSAYFAAFTAGSETGDRPIVLASALMPAVAVRFVAPLPPAAQTAVVEEGCTRLVDYAAVVAGSARPELARRTLDAMIEPEFQFALSDERGSAPARTDLVRRPEVAAFGAMVQPVVLDPVTTAGAVPALLRAWDEAGALADGQE